MCCSSAVDGRVLAATRLVRPFRCHRETGRRMISTTKYCMTAAATRGFVWLPLWLVSKSPSGLHYQSDAFRIQMLTENILSFTVLVQSAHRSQRLTLMYSLYEATTLHLDYVVCVRLFSCIIILHACCIIVTW